jgi:small subunit ribosomal protein S4
MAKYTGPRCKLCRRQGSKLFLKGERCVSTKCAMEPKRRPYPPGPKVQRRRKSTDYSLQLREKQKARQIFGVLERQFRRNFALAEKRPGATGEELLRILELRLDNVVYRMGYADSRSQARQLISHGHFSVNGRRTNIPSFECKINQVIAIRPESMRLEYFQALAKEIGHKSVPQWLSLEVDNMVGKVLAVPSRDDIVRDDMPGINEALIVEFYSR